MAGCLIPILFPAIFTSLFSLTSQSPQIEDLISNSQEPKFQIAHLESVLEERIREINAKSSYLDERVKLIEDMSSEIRQLQSMLSSVKDGSSHADEKLQTLEDKVRLLWEASRKMNFEIHILESKAQDAEDRLGLVTSQAEEMAAVVTEQWIQMQHLEQALQHAKIRARAQRAQRQTSMRCTFLKFVNDVAEKHIPNFWGMVDSYFFGENSTLRPYIFQSLQKFQDFFSAIKKYHHELQGIIKREMEKNEFTAALANEELVFFLVSALITFPILGAWMLLMSHHG